MENCQTSLTFKKCTLKQHNFSYFRRGSILKMIRSSDAKDTVKWAFWYSGEGGDAKAAFWNALYEKSEKYLYLGAKLFIFHEFILGENQRLYTDLRVQVSIKALF